jgi:molybdate transport system regulatory protein
MMDLIVVCSAAELRRILMRISARNILAGEVAHVIKGAVNCEIAIALKDSGSIVTAIITNSSADSLGLAKGNAAYAVIKASEVMVGKGLETARLSARNILPGTICQLQDGAVNSEVIIRLSGGAEIAASITRESVAALELKMGDRVSAVIKASNVLVGVDH